MPDMSLAYQIIITGKVYNSDNEPLSSAAVILRCENRQVRGAFTDSEGRFKIDIEDSDCSSMTLNVSLIGYFKTSQKIRLSSDSQVVNFILEEAPVRTDDIIVKPDRKPSLLEVSLNQDLIARSSRRSLFPTNPISAIKAPPVVRQGSNHSSKIRVYGTNPEYLINGMAIGYDPVHYGLFSVIPGSVIDEIRFKPMGTPAQYALPSIVDIKTSRDFNKHSTLMFDLSIIESTASFFGGNENYFILSSYRKSIIDKLADHINYSTDRACIPPSGFRDIFISAGWKINGKSRLILDQYHVEDHLSYEIEPTGNNPEGISTRQKTDDHFIGLKYEYVSERVFYDLFAAVKSGAEGYYASPPDKISTQGFRVDLKAKEKSFLGGFDTETLFGKSLFTFGGKLNYTLLKQIELSQYNWNFLPPDAPSDNPFIYQDQLNLLYGRYSSSRDEFTGSLYSSFKYPFGIFELETGLRIEHFGNLHKKNAFLYRNTLRIDIPGPGNLELFYGAFAESPLTRILEPCQILINSYQEQLTPVYTELFSLGYKFEPITINLFTKSIKNVPFIDPDFDQISVDGEAVGEFLKMKSGSHIHICGGDIGFDSRKFFSNRFAVKSFYSYARATKSKQDIDIPYDLDVPHKFNILVDCRVSGSIALGAELSLRSGYPYTPTYTDSLYQDENKYSRSYYRQILEMENSKRFPTNINLNIYTEFAIKRLEIYLSILNLTNHGNPIINTRDGFIYDTGILPGIGIRYSI
jgi:hypothetical protein